jgi:hypothetical protein
MGPSDLARRGVADRRGGEREGCASAGGTSAGFDLTRIDHEQLRCDSNTVLADVAIRRRRARARPIGMNADVEPNLVAMRASDLGGDCRGRERRDFDRPCVAIRLATANHPVGRESMHRVGIKDGKQRAEICHCLAYCHLAPPDSPLLDSLTSGGAIARLGPHRTRAALGVI